MKVSIIVPVYNSENYIKDCLDSLINQTLKELEIIVIDDASADHSLNIIEEYVMKYPDKIKVIQNEKNIGQSATRNKGIKIANGEYIGFLDSDDYVNYTLYQAMYEGALAHHKPEVITTGLNFVKNNDQLKCQIIDLREEKGQIYKVLETPDMILSQSPSVCNKLFRKDVIKDNLFLEGRMWEDVAFSFAKMFNANYILNFDRAGYFYRKRIDEGVSSKSYDLNPHLLDIFTVADQIEKEVKEQSTSRYEQLKPQIKFIQSATCLQRIVEIMSWNISDADKRELCYYMNALIIKKYGDWRKIPIEELSSKVGFLELEKLKSMVIKEENFGNLEEQLTKKINSIKK